MVEEEYLIARCDAFANDFTREIKNSKLDAGYLQNLDVLLYPFCPSFMG